MEHQNNDKDENQNVTKLHCIILHQLISISKNIKLPDYWIIQAIKDASNVSSAGSKLLTEYMEESLIILTKRNFRFMLTFLALFIVIQIPFDDDVKDNLDAGGFLVFSIIFLIMMLYLQTFKCLSHHTYTQLSTVLSLIGNSMIFMQKSLRLQIPSRLSIAGLLVNFIILVFCPINFSTSFLVSLTFLTAYLMHIANSIYINPSPYSQANITSSNHQINNRKHSVVILLISNLLLWLLTMLIGGFLKYMLNFRLKASFLCLGQGIQARLACQKAVREQRQWIEAVVPSQVSREYWKMRKAKEELGSKMWVYCRTFDNVSILFSDIVGFTKMSSNKQASQIVMLLNDLFNRFDDLCEHAHCEKIGTLGDCYYCVSGCPVPRSDHAPCCIEMGLGMCRIIRSFNRDYGEEVNMRVGIHTGRVNAAIIGNQRFRYDVYSYDVIIANEMESSGRPGRVHISETTFQQIKLLYNVTQTDDVLIRKEEISGIAGMVLTTIPIKTYFVDQRSSVLRKKHENYGKKHNSLRIIELRNSNSELFEENEDFDEKVIGLNDDSVDSNEDNASKDIPITSPNYTELISSKQIKLDNNWSLDKKFCINMVMTNRHEFAQDFALIESMQNDPLQQIKNFCNLPIDSLTNRFLDPELEWHYLIGNNHRIRPSYVHSLKIVPLIDVTVAALVLIILLTYSWIYRTIVYPSFTWRELFLTLVVLFFTLLLTSLVSWIVISLNPILDSHWKYRLFCFLVHPAVKEIIFAVFSVLPILIVLMNDIDKNNYLAYDCRQIMVTVISLIFPVLFVSSSARIRNILQIFNLLVIFSSYQIFVNVFYIDLSVEAHCINQTDYWSEWRNKGGDSVLLAELFLVCLVAGMLANENERVMRLCFFVFREMEISLDDSNQAEEAGRRLLNNIIPSYVLDVLRSQEKISQQKIGINYSVSLTNVGVFFASITNFFSSYYREDYKGGENALQLLNTIICTFEDHLSKAEFKDIEKIKTINDCYMVASGLNKASLANNSSWCEHLIALMRYAHAIQKSLIDINEQYIVGTDKFIIKIGYNYGPVTAGVIGTTKPMYDIWGDTVNVASRMYSTGAPGIVQCPEYVSTALSDFFFFEYRGEIFVKGKGIMRTFTCREHD